jgi:hypothetical protein
MVLCCTEEFKQEVEKLRKNGSYADIEQAIIAAYCKATFAAASTGDTLGVMPGMAYVKKRVDGRGGYRFYVLAVVKGEVIYLSFVHPKTGRYGMDNVTPEKKKAILREVLSAIRQQSFYKVEEDADRTGRLSFSAYRTQPAL